MKRLTQARIRTLEPGPKPKLYSTGEHTLYVLVQPGGGRSFVQRLHIAGRSTDLGLGSCEFTTLTEARERAFDNRRVARRGGDPRDAKRAARIPTVAVAVDAVLSIQRSSWKDGGKSERQWRHSFNVYAEGIMGRPVDSLDTSDMLAVIAPIWNAKRVTAKRLKQRLGAVMKWAIAEGHRKDNPVDAVGAVLPKSAPNVTHFKAIPFTEVAAALEVVGSVGRMVGCKSCFPVHGTNLREIRRSSGRTVG